MFNLLKDELECLLIAPVAVVGVIISSGDSMNLVVVSRLSLAVTLLGLLQCRAKMRTRLLMWWLHPR